MTKILSKCIRVSCTFAVMCIVLPATAQETPSGKRIPATILKPEDAGILLSEWRVALEAPDKVLNFMGLQDGDLVADIGCGNGLYSLQVAERIKPHGSVFAVDVQQGMLDLMLARRDEAGIKNIYPILGTFEDPLLPPGKMDWVLLVDAYHEFSDPVAMLATIKKCLAPGGRVALLEYRAEQDPASTPIPIPRDHKMNIDEVMSEWTSAGFELVTRAEFLPAQHFFIFKAADDNVRRPIRSLTVKDTRNVSTYDNKVYFAGQPTEEGFATFKELGIKTVINLRTEPEIASLKFDEKQVVEDASMKYIQISMGRELPTKETLDKMMEAITMNDDAPMLIHCASSNRVGTIWSYFIGTRSGLDIETAIAEGKSAGMRAASLEKEVREILAP